MREEGMRQRQIDGQMMIVVMLDIGVRASKDRATLTAEFGMPEIYIFAARELMRGHVVGAERDRVQEKFRQ